MSNSARKGLFLTVTLVAVLLSACHRDPTARRQKYLESGQRFFDKEKYREAAIQIQNAIQADPKYAESHYQLSRCYMKLGIAREAYQQLMKTIELDPNHWQAHIDLGNLL